MKQIDDILDPDEFNDPLPFDDTQHTGGSTGCYLIMVAGGLIIAAVVIYFLLSLSSTYNI